MSLLDDPSRREDRRQNQRHRRLYVSPGSRTLGPSSLGDEPPSVTRFGTPFAYPARPPAPLAEDERRVLHGRAALGIGIPQPLFTTTFAAARTGGWMAHALEQKRDNRLVRPVSQYVGASGRSWVPLDERSG